MELGVLKKQIKEKKLDSFYIFCGEEWKVQEIYLNQMASVIGRKVYADSFPDIYGKLKSGSIIGHKRTLYVVRDDHDLMTNEKLQDRLESLLSDNVLVLVVSSVDKRLKFYKRYKLSLVEFSPLETPILRRYVDSEIKLSNSNRDLLISICENNYGRVLLEIDKIKRFSDDYDEAFLQLVESGVIYDPPSDGMDYLATELIRGHATNSFDLLDQCKEFGVATMFLISGIYEAVRAVLQVQTCTSKDVCKSTGLPYWAVKKTEGRVGYRNNESLINMLKLIREVEIGIKTGKIEEEVALEYLIACVL